MSENHTYSQRDFGRTFAVGIVLNTIYVIVEAAVGFAAGSLALVADAGHNASDVLSLAVAWAAANLAKRPPTERYTYGLSRSPILASLFNALLLFGAMAIVAWEAVRRLPDTGPVPGVTIIWVAVIGLAVNLGTALMLARGRSDLNIRGAFLHMVADAGVTFGVLVSGIVILSTGVKWLDPAISLAIVAVVLWSTWGLFRDAMRLSLDAVPEGIEPEEVRRFLLTLPGVSEVHDMHIWAMSTTDSALTAHLVAPQMKEDANALIREACRGLSDRFDIGHTTLQIENHEDADACKQRSPHHN